MREVAGAFDILTKGGAIFVKQEEVGFGQHTQTAQTGGDWAVSFFASPRFTQE